MDLGGVYLKQLWIPFTFDGDTPTSYTRLCQVYGYLPNRGTRLFPQGTSGFFYLHKLTGAPEVTAEIRFRVTRDPDPKSFHSGSDLILRGVPWGLPLLAQKTSYFDALLLHKGFVSQEFSKIRQHLQTIQLASPILFAFKQPFLVETGNFKKHNICYLEDGEPKLQCLGWHTTKYRLTEVGKLVSSRMSCAMLKQSAGLIVARFERYPDGPADTVCLRVAEIKPRAERLLEEDVRQLLNSNQAKLWGQESELGKPWTFTIPSKRPPKGQRGHLLWNLGLLRDLPDDTAW